MKLIYYTIICLLFCGCIDDNSKEIYPENNPNFSFITISSLTDTLSVDYGQSLVFAPNVTQKEDAGKLSYRWTANKVVDNSISDEMECGNDAELNYAFAEPGEYKLKLEVGNRDYIEAKSWVVNVRVYDNGYFVVGNDDATGLSTISFARDLSSQDILEGKKQEFSIDIIKKVNPDYEIKNVVKIIKSIISYGKSDAYLHIFTADKIYAADPITFEIFYVSDFSKAFPGEEIVDVGVFDSYATSAYIVTSKNRMVQYNKAEFGLMEISNGNMSSRYGDCYVGQFSLSGPNLNDNYYLVDREKSIIYTYISYFEYAGGKNPASSIMVKQEDGKFVEDPALNIFADYDILSLFKMNGESFSGQNTNMFAVSKSKAMNDSYMIVEYNVNMNNAFEIQDVIEFDQENNTWNEECKLIPNGRYNCVYYSKDSKIYIWYPKNVAPNNKFPTKEAIDLGAGKEVTFMRISHDMRQLYVGFYDNNSTESLKGGFYIYDASKIGIESDLQALKKFENITSRPVDIAYKTLKNDSYNSN